MIPASHLGEIRGDLEWVGFSLLICRTQEVRNGIFVPYEGANAQVKQGVNLVVTKASNKGAVGMGFR